MTDPKAADIQQRAQEFYAQTRSGNTVDLMLAFAQSELDRRGVRSEWRDVKVELPPVSDDELLLVTVHGVRTGWFGISKRWNLRGGRVVDFDFVTHWQPLPSPPTAEQKEKP